MSQVQDKIEIKALTKDYKGLRAVDHVSLEIEKGEIFGFLGPNGSGKTTTFLMVLGFTNITEGSVSVFGVNPVCDNMQIKKTVAYLPDTLGFYTNMCVLDNLLYTGRLLDLDRQEAMDQAMENLSLVGLKSAAKKYASELSRGMRQRLGIADLLMKKPKVIILDEPTLGLDPNGANEFLDLIVRLSHEQGITVLMSSHQLEHVQKICDRIAIYRQGKVLDVGTPEHLIETVAMQQSLLGVICIRTPEEALQKTLCALPGVHRLRNERFCTVLEVECGQMQTVATELLKAGCEIKSMDDKSTSMEAVYRYYFS